MEKKENLVKYGSLSHLDQECVTVNKCNNIQLNEIRFFSYIFSREQLHWHFDITLCYVLLQHSRVPEFAYFPLGNNVNKTKWAIFFRCGVVLTKYRHIYVNRSLSKNTVQEPNP